jgi:hypothetical protein
MAGGYHTHVLSDVPEDTDVMLVLTRQPRVPEIVGAGGYIFTIAVDGTITDVRTIWTEGSLPEESRPSAAELAAITARGRMLI